MAGRGAPRARPARAPDRHFLRSPRLAAAVVRDAGISADDLVLDLGAGTGRLTAPLAERARSVVAVELDPVLSERLRERFRGSPTVRVVEGDAVGVPLPVEPFRVVGNIPFGVTTAILRRLLGDPRVPVVRADLVVEWGLGCKRARLIPSTLLGVYWGAWFELAVTRRLPRACFEPAPRVDAAVLRAVRRPEPLVPLEHARAYLAFLRRAFAGEPVVRSKEARRTARELGVASHAPARELDAHQWAALYGSVRRGPLHFRPTQVL